MHFFLGALRVNDGGTIHMIILINIHKILVYVLSQIG